MKILSRAFRLDAETDRMLSELAQAEGGSRTAALKAAVRVAHNQWLALRAMTKTTISQVRNRKRGD